MLELDSSGKALWKVGRCGFWFAKTKGLIFKHCTQMDIKHIFIPCKGGHCGIFKRCGAGRTQKILNNATDTIFFTINFIIAEEVNYE